MAMIFMDGFTHYDDGEVGHKYDSIGGAPAITPGAGRFGDHALTLTSPSQIVRKNVPAAATYIASVVWFSINTSTFPGGSPFITFRNDADGVDHVEIRPISNGAVEVVRLPSTVLLTSAPGVMTPARWHSIEFKATISETVGAIEVRVDEVAVIGPQGGLDTRNGGTADEIDQVILSGENNQWKYDIFYIMDTTGGKNDDFLGDRRIDLMYPDGDTVEADFTRSAGANNFENVDELLADGDTTYNESSTVTDTDRYTLTAMNFVPTVIDAIAVNVHARKDDAGGRSIEVICESNAVEDLGGSEALNTTFKFFQHVVEQNPDGPADWTETTVNAMTAGQEVKA